MARTRMSFVTSWLAIAAYIAIPMAASAQVSDARELDIEEQALSDALKTVADEFGLQIAFFSESTAGLQAEPLVGTYTPDQAFDVLLADTALVHTQLDNGTVVVQPEELEGIRPGKSRPASSPMLMAQDRTSAPQNRTASASGSIRDDEYEAAVKKREEIVVTGSRIRGAQSVSPVTIVSRQEIDAAGIATVERLVQVLPQNFAGGAGQEQFSDSFSNVGIGNFAGSEVSIDLRGLGPDSTLVLLNGRRLTSGGLNGEFVDISSIPVSAIERVEILTDGASAIYGADAIAGVVNFILLDNYDGAETRLRYGPDFGSNTSNVRLAQLLGQSWETGNLLFSYEYYKQNNLDTADRPVAANSDLRPLGGDDWSQVGGNPGTIVAGGDTFAIPPGQDGTALTPADFAGLEGTVNLRNRREGQDLLGEQERHSAMLVLSQEFSERTEYFLEARYSERASKTRTFQDSSDLTVPNSNPFFVDPTGTGLTTVTIENYSFVRDIGPTINDGDVETIGVTTGISRELGAYWGAELSGSYAREESSNRLRNFVNRAAAAAAAAESDPQSALNPFGDGSNTNPTVLDTLRASGLGSDAEHDAWSLHLDFTGPLFEMREGSVQVATGVEYRSESLQTSSRTGPQIGDPVSMVPGANTDRQMVGAYAEVFFPLVGPSADRLGLHRLEVSVAGRYEDYDDFGDTVTPKLGILWSPTQSLNFRSTFGTSFKPPLLTELDTTPSFLNFDTWLGFTPVPALFRVGGNANLTAEKATSWTAGFQILPSNLSGLSIDVTYFDVDVEDRIRRPAPSLVGVFAPEFASLVNLAPTQEEIAAIANSPRYRNFGGATPQDLIDGLVPVGAIVDFQLQNVAGVELDGVDALLRYELESTAGNFAFGLNGSYLFNIDHTLLPTDPASVNRLDTVGNPVDLRLRGNLSWSRGAWGASAFVHYTDSYVNDERDLEERIDSWTTVDLQLSYDMREHFAGSWLDDIRLSLTIQNVLDEAPPFVNLQRGIGYDPTNANALGRLFSLELVKNWGEE